MRISDWSSDVCSSDLVRARPQVGDRGHDRQAVVDGEAGDPQAQVVLDRKQLHHGGEAALRNRGDLGGLWLRHLSARAFAVLEASRPPAHDAAAEPLGGHFGVPLVAAVAEIVDAAKAYSLGRTA